MCKYFMNKGGCTEEVTDRHTDVPRVHTMVMNKIRMDRMERNHRHERKSQIFCRRKHG